MSIRVYQPTGERTWTRAQQIWEVLTARVQMQKLLGQQDITITYGDVCEQIGWTRQCGQMLAIPLGIVGHFCIDNDLPTLNVIVVNKGGGQPGSSYVITRGRTLIQEIRAIRKVEWFTIMRPTAKQLRDTYEDWKGEDWQED